MLARFVACSVLMVTIASAVLATNSESHSALRVPMAVQPPDLKGTTKGGQPKYNFSFDKKSIYGPLHWNNFSPDCAAKDQSPINISRESVHRDTLNHGMLEVDYSVCDHASVQTGALGISIACKTESKVRFHGVDYVLKSLHYRAPGEHKFDGQSADAELHMVHKSTVDGKLLIVVRLLDSTPNVDDPFMAKWWGALARTAQGLKVPISGQLSPIDNIPNQLDFFYYSGSLTTPPCTLGVTWVIMESPAAISKKQLSYLQGLYKANGGSSHVIPARDVAQLGDRVVHYHQAAAASNVTSSHHRQQPEELEEISQPFVTQVSDGTPPYVSSSPAGMTDDDAGAATVSDMQDHRQRVQKQIHKESVAWNTIRALRTEKEGDFAKSALYMANAANSAAALEAVSNGTISGNGTRIDNSTLLRDGELSSNRVPVIDVAFLSGPTAVTSEDIAHIFGVDKNRLFLMRVRNDYAMGFDGHEMWQYKFNILGAVVPGEPKAYKILSHIMSMNGTTSITDNGRSRLSIAVNVCPADKAGNICSNHGSCVRNDTCVCDVGYYGFNCNKESDAAMKYPDVLDIVDQVIENLHYDHQNHNGLIRRETKIIRDKLDECNQDISRLQAMMESLGPDSAWGDTEMQIGLKMRQLEDDRNKKAAAINKPTNGLMTQLDEALGDVSKGMLRKGKGGLSGSKKQKDSLQAILDSFPEAFHEGGVDAPMGAGVGTDPSELDEDNDSSVSAATQLPRTAAERPNKNTEADGLMNVLEGALGNVKAGSGLSSLTPILKSLESATNKKK